MMSYGKMYLDEHARSGSFDVFESRIRKSEIITRVTNLMPLVESLLEIGPGLYPIVLSGVRTVTVEADPLIADAIDDKVPDLVCCSALDFSPSDESFDVIVLNSVLHEVDDPVAVLIALRRLMSDRAAMVISVPNARSIHRELGASAGYIGSVYELSETDVKFGRKRKYVIDELSSLVGACGLTVAHSWTHFFKPFPSELMEKLDRDVLWGFVKLSHWLPHNGSELYVIVRKSNEVTA